MLFLVIFFIELNRIFLNIFLVSFSTDVALEVSQRHPIRTLYLPSTIFSSKVCPGRCLQLLKGALHNDPPAAEEPLDILSLSSLYLLVIPHNITS